MPLNFVAVVGGANMDIVARTDGSPLKGDSTPGKIHCSAGGVARNVAENLARLNHKVHLISAVGDDEFGRSLLSATQAAGVNVDDVHVVEGERTATYLSVHGTDGEMIMAVNDMAILNRFTPTWVQSHAEWLEKASLLVLDSNLSAAVLSELMRQAVRMPVFVDGVSVQKCQRLQGLLGSIHTLKVNQLEAHALTGLPTGSIDETQAAALELHRMGVSNVVISQGAFGVCWCDAAGVVGARAANPTAVVNSSGAGDALIAGLVHAFLSGQTLVEAVPFAMACAEMTLSSPFANHPALSVSAAQALQSP